MAAADAVPRSGFVRLFALSCSQARAAASLSAQPLVADLAAQPQLRLAPDVDGANRAGVTHLDLLWISWPQRIAVLIIEREAGLSEQLPMCIVIHR
jgi:hypothetical protein